MKDNEPLYTKERLTWAECQQRQAELQRRVEEAMQAGNLNTALTAQLKLGGFMLNIAREQRSKLADLMRGMHS